jgi:WD40 repeat protein
LECLVCNSTEDFCFIGSSTGSIIKMEMSAVTSNTLNISVPKSQQSPSAYKILDGHVKSVTSLSMSSDNCTLISTSADGSMKLWDIWTNQCIKECKPLNKSAITSSLVKHILLLYLSTRKSLIHAYAMVVLFVDKDNA